MPPGPYGYGMAYGGYPGMMMGGYGAYAGYGAPYAAAAYPAGPYPQQQQQQRTPPPSRCDPTADAHGRRITCSL